MKNILGYFDTEEEVVNEGAEETIGTETTNAMNSVLDSDSLSREEYILNYFDIPLKMRLPLIMMN